MAGRARDPALPCCVPRRLLRQAASGDSLRDERRLLSDATTFMSGSPRVTRAEEISDVMNVVLCATDLEPAVVGAPIESRILMVADHWAQLTAADGEQLSQQRALMHLRHRAGGPLDPQIVGAVDAIVLARRLPHRQPLRTRARRSARLA